MAFMLLGAVLSLLSLATLRHARRIKALEAQNLALYTALHKSLESQRLMLTATHKLTSIVHEAQQGAIVVDGDVVN